MHDVIVFSAYCHLNRLSASLSLVVGPLLAKVHFCATSSHFEGLSAQKGASKWLQDTHTTRCAHRVHTDAHTVCTRCAHRCAHDAHTGVHTMRTPMRTRCAHDAHTDVHTMRTPVCTRCAHRVHTVCTRCAHGVHASFWVILGLNRTTRTSLFVRHHRIFGMLSSQPFVSLSFASHGPSSCQGPFLRDIIAL